MKASIVGELVGDWRDGDLVTVQVEQSDLYDAVYLLDARSVAEARDILRRLTATAPLIAGDTPAIVRHAEATRANALLGLEHIAISREAAERAKLVNEEQLRLLRLSAGPMDEISQLVEDLAKLKPHSMTWAEVGLIITRAQGLMARLVSEDDS